VPRLRFFAGGTSDFTSYFTSVFTSDFTSDLTAFANRTRALLSSASLSSPSQSFPRLRFFDVTVVTSDLTLIFAVFFELILVLLQSII
jgi:hypothetical protein